MRVNVKRVAVVATVCALLWLAFTLLSNLQIPELPSTERRVDPAALEHRLQVLETVVEQELAEGREVLRMLREKHARKMEEEAKAASVRAALSQPILPVLVIACNRVNVSRCLDKLIKYRPSVETFPIIISQDCNHRATYEVIEGYVAEHPGVSVVRQPDQSKIGLAHKEKTFEGYYRIARHYKFALSHVLDELQYESVIIVEDDLDISEDFYEYFLGTYPLLQQDPSIWCISAWNDNGKKGLIEHARPELLHRTDFFPGLGWLLPARVWLQLKSKWPAAFFDDWLRRPEQTSGRACIRPEIPRTSTFGKEGVSKGLFFDLHLRFIQLNTKFVPFTQLDLTYLLKENYDRQLLELVERAEPLSLEQVLEGAGDPLRSAKVLYTDRLQFKKVARALGLMDDFRSGVPRTAYRGIVSCYHKNRRVYIVPHTPFTSYDPSWS